MYDIYILFIYIYIYIYIYTYLPTKLFLDIFKNYKRMFANLLKYTENDIESHKTLQNTKTLSKNPIF